MLKDGNSKMNFNKITRNIALILFFLFISSNAFADILKLVDGSVVQGKVIRENERLYFFTNTYGTFEVQKVHVEKLFTTNSYKEDIQVSEQNSLNIDVEMAEANYEAGMRKKMLIGKKRGKKKYFEYWDYGRISISATYFTTISADVAGGKTVNTVLPNGFSGQFVYEQGLDMLLDLGKKKKTKDGRRLRSRKKFRKTKQRPPMMPGLRVEFSYLYFTKDLFVDNGREISGSTITLGPMWSFPSPHNVWGCFMLAALPGYSFLRINNRDVGEYKDNYSFAMTLIFGYEYAIKEKVALLFHARYTYIDDKKVAFHGIGGSFGLSFRLW